MGEDFLRSCYEKVIRMNWKEGGGINSHLRVMGICISVGQV
jgi:hypothetical protein